MINIKKPNKTHSTIPKIIHQIWIGTRPPPLIWINTWIKFCKKFKWQHMLWDNNAVAKIKLINKKEFDNATSFQQKSDILRYEIMYKYGGIYLDADMVWLGKNISLYLPLDSSNFIGVQEPLSSFYSILGEPFLANGFFCCTKKHIIMKKCIKLLPSSFKKYKKAFLSTGPRLLNEVVKNYPIDLIPLSWVFPVNFKNINTGSYKEFLHKGLIFTNSGFTIHEKLNILEMPKILNNYINRLLYV